MFFAFARVVFPHVTNSKLLVCGLFESDIILGEYSDLRIRSNRDDRHRYTQKQERLIPVQLPAAPSWSGGGKL
jgi:hypothetical protein